MMTVTQHSALKPHPHPNRNPNRNGNRNRNPNWEAAELEAKQKALEDMERRLKEKE